MRFLGFVVLLAVLALLWLLTMPAQLTYHDGTRPAVDYHHYPCPGDDPGTANCTGVTSFRWRLPAGARANTTFEVSRDGVSSVRGTFRLTGECAARVEWTLTVNDRETGGVLAVGERAEVNVEEPPSALRLRVRRTDTADCAAEFRWNNPEVPAFGFP